MMFMSTFFPLIWAVAHGCAGRGLYRRRLRLPPSNQIKRLRW